ncbi:flavin reductase (DIM6/NTAB) family NADH-FMN oxidoreductase RutF [Rhodococcus sp. SMB37]|nr:flavin reductase (DIM6/NTAB) family NADH-FMN oxidoreductase RutF [Rhodococcus sp. SMB37]
MGTGEPFDALMAMLDPSMLVVTAAAGGERGGCLVGFHAQSSIAPGRYTVWLSKANHTYRLALRATHLGLHFLDRDASALAERFGTLTGDEVDKFAGLMVRAGPGGAPELPTCRHRMLSRRIALLDEGGDHVCVVTEPVAVTADGPLTPLRLSAVAHLRPGHPAAERPHPATARADHPGRR